MKRIDRTAIIACSADTFYALVEEIEAYPSFLPWCAAAQVLEREPGRTKAMLTLAVKGVRQSFTTENTNVPGRSIDMRLVEGPFRHFLAGWRFTPLEAQAVKVEFTLEYEFSSRVVAVLLNPVFKRIADETVNAFTRRAVAHAHG